MTIHIIGMPMDLGQGRRGVDMGPSAIRYAGIGERLKDLGYKVVDDGDLTIKTQEEQRVKDPHAKYLPEIARACNVLARKVEKIAHHGDFPLVLGGDHSIAIGTIAGLSANAQQQELRAIPSAAFFMTIPKPGPSRDREGADTRKTACLRARLGSQKAVSWDRFMTVLRTLPIYLGQIIHRGSSQIPGCQID